MLKDLLAIARAQQAILEVKGAQKTGGRERELQRERESVYLCVCKRERQREKEFIRYDTS
jgi:hypothetical protein